MAGSLAGLGGDSKFLVFKARAEGIQNQEARMSRIYEPLERDATVRVTVHGSGRV